MKRVKSLILVLALALPLATLATDATWVNNGTIVIAPNIDATNVINNGTINIATVQPFDTSNTRNFTNSGTMNGSVGFRFDNAPRNSSGQLIGQRVLAQNFHNRNSGAVNGTTYLLVQATNVINSGLLTIGPGGLLQVTGTNLNLSRGRMGVDSAGLGGSGSINGDTNFFPDVAIYDNYWGQTNMTFNSSTILNYFGPLPFVTSPAHQVTVGAGNFLTQIQVVNPVIAGYSNAVGAVSLSLTNDTGGVTNIIVPTNIVRQAVFVVSSNPTNYLASIRFYPSSSLTNPMQTVAVELAVLQTNLLTGAIVQNAIYFVDTLASETNRGTLLNVVDGTRRPANYLVSRVPVFEYFFGAPGNIEVTNNFLYEANFASPIVSGAYAGYSAFLDSAVLRPPNIPAGTVTNLPGRVEIDGGSVNLDQTRMRAEGYLSVKAKHLISSTNAVVDCENLSYNLASTNGLLSIQNLTKPTVQRVSGDLFAWSAVWTNAYTEIYTNYDASTNPVVLVPVTNTVNIQIHALILDASQILGSLPVLIHNFRAKATNIVMNDSGTIVADFLLDGQSFTLTGNLTLANSLVDWNYLNAPQLRYFTNLGSLTVPSEAHFGDDGPLNYLGFVNRGIITSVGQNIDSDYTELAGTNLVSAAFNVAGLDAKVEDGRISAGGDILFATSTLKFNRALVQAGGRLVVDVTGALLDNGPLSSNVISCGDGLILGTKPATGDLLGTSLQTVAPAFALVDHYWAGEDRGATRAGFSNNVAVGRLTPIPAGVGTAFGFTGVGLANGLYVDLLDLSQLTDYANQLLIDPSLTIYYAAAKLNFTPAAGLTVEEYLDGQLGGRLRWVSQYAGPNSSVDVVINGNQTIKVNKALRNSTTIDSDSDGIPNYFDLSPFDGVTITSITRSVAPPGFALAWDAAPNTVYRVEYKTNLAATVWTQLLLTTNTAAAVVPWSVVDTNGVSGPQRYYRVSYNPNGP